MLPAAFEAILPEDPASAVVLSVPHAGTDVDTFAPALAPGLDVRCDADLFVDQLYAGAPRGASIRALVSRFVCDLNRDPDDVSQRAVPDHPRPRNTDGRGFVWEVTTTGAPALARPLALAEWAARKAIHDGYHGAIASAMSRARTKFGHAILVDGHSMPSVGRQEHADPGRPRADVVPGDRLGKSCAAGLSRLVGEHFRARGLTVTFNEPYRGGYITAHHGRPADHYHAIQIELRRDLYMDEASFTPLPDKLARLRSVLAELLRALDGYDPRRA